jgi:hypothetical protein
MRQTVGLGDQLRVDAWSDGPIVAFFRSLMDTLGVLLCEKTQELKSPSCMCESE